MSETARSGSGSFRPFREKFIGRLSPRVGGALRKKRITLISKMQGLPSARARARARSGRTHIVLPDPL